MIVQSDRTVLLEVHSPHAEAAREAISPFAELIKSPEHIHTYRLTPLSVWNARSAGIAVADMLAALRRFSKYPVPESILQEIETLGQRYGLTTIDRMSAIDAQSTESQGCLILRVSDRPLAELLARHDSVTALLGNRLSDTAFSFPAHRRGLLKQGLLAAGYPAEDIAGYITGEALSIRLRDQAMSGERFAVRSYQREAAEAFHQSGSARGGSGTIVLPCGAGKTIVGMAAMAAVGENTLVLTTGQTSINQWRREILDKTHLNEDQIAEYTGHIKETGPVTLTTYQILTWRPNREAEFPHFALLRQREWGLIIYDEVHLLPAEVFRITAELQARRRLGLTATLVREDGRETDVFALIGPKRYDVPWRDLEGQGYIAAADCTEIRVPMSDDMRMEYALAPNRQRFRVASENPAKMNALDDVISHEQEESRDSQARILIIGEYLSQLGEIARQIGWPLVVGKTPQTEREEIYRQFRSGLISGLVLSRVGNFALDLPDADVLIQVSGKYGSRQEEAQRLGRILRPKKSGARARFYTLVSQRTCEEEFARNRQIFLTEQGYRYQIKIIDCEAPSRKV
ncbi:MAG: helicase-associated domain-containing protein [Capsulimonadaceae bacterium]|nr:helicase-associated domain-containing protein [Capsulimonadaceae bacterium]